MFARNEKETYWFLAFYRFLSYALAVMFVYVRPSASAAPEIPSNQIIVLLTALGVYSALRVFPISWRQAGGVTYFILGGDFLVGMLLVIFTGGLNSAFLLYSLSPIVTAALLFEEKIAVTLAAFASLALSVTHLTFSHPGERFAPIMQAPNLTLLIIYTLFCFVIAAVPYRTNLNLRKLIETGAAIGERRRIARELHDGVAQALGYLNLKTRRASDFVSSHDTAKALAELGEIRKVAQDTYEDIRESIDQLSAETMSLPFIPAITSYVGKFGNGNGLKVSFDYSRPFPELSPVAGLQLLRIAQEALTNVRRHARATEVEVKLENHNQAVKMLVKDNGRGFVPGNPGQSLPGYHGLNIIKERAEALGGTVDIATAPGGGTTVAVNLPLNKVRL